MKPLAMKLLLGVTLVATLGGCCIRPVSGAYVYETHGGPVCYDYSSGGYYHGSAPHYYRSGPVHPPGVSTYRAPAPHPAPSARHGGNHGGHGGSPHPNPSSQGYRGGHR